VVRSGCLALVFFVASGSSCLLYTDPINHPPEVALTGDTETTFHSDQRPKYHARAHDPDQSADSLTYQWHRQLGDCPSAANVMVGAPVASGPDFENDLDFTAKFCVWVVVRDERGATAWAEITTSVTHLKTTAVIEVVKPFATAAAGATADRFPLMSAVQLSGTMSSDLESHGPLDFEWTLTRGGQAVTHEDCPDGAIASELCFTGDQPGTYRAILKVRDTRGGEATATKDVVIEPDAPPCIRRSDPMYGLARIVRDATEKNVFELKMVTDDVDPFPAPPDRASKLSFDITWWREGDANPPSGRRATGPGDQMPVAEFIPDYFKNGDQVFVRIKAIDRIDRDFSACERDKVDDCALEPQAHPDCYQWVTWRIDFRPLRAM
jgi:hypothetical protein